MEVNPAPSATSESTETLLEENLHQFPANQKSVILDYKLCPDISEQNNLQDHVGHVYEGNWRPREGKKTQSLMNSKYRMGGSVESVFSLVSAQHPRWIVLASSKSQEALTYEGQSDKLLHETEKPDVVDDVVGDEVIFKSPGQKSHGSMDYRLNQSVPQPSVASTGNTLVGSDVAKSEFLAECITHDGGMQTTESNIYRPTIHEAGHVCSNVYRLQNKSPYSSSFFTTEDKEMLESVTEWTKDANTIRSFTSEEKNSSHSQDAESDGSQNISISLLKSIFMEREDKINSLRKELRRIQTENLCLLEEKQCLLSENQTLRKEFEVMTFDKVRTKQDVLNSFDPSSPFILQRQIENLKNQVNDLQEANESAVSELAKADEEISQQKKEMAKQKADYNYKLEESQEEIKALIEKIKHMPKRFMQPEDYEHDLNKEITQLRVECRQLRALSHQRNEENRYLKEQLWDSKRQHEGLPTKFTYQKNVNGTAASHWHNPLRNTLQSKSWQSANNSLYRNDAFKDDGTFSKCKAALGSLNIKEPWESKYEERNTSPVSMESENTDVLIMGYHEESPCKPSQADSSGGAHEELQDLSDEEFCSVSQSNGITHWNPPHQSPKDTKASTSSFRAGTNIRSFILKPVLPRRPFAPKTVADLKVGNLVKFSRPGGKISNGTIQYKGHLHGREDVYLGVELEGIEVGKHDGTFQGRRYFLCKPNKGVFVNFSKIIMAWE